MGEILGLGITHHPGLASANENLNGPLKMVLQDPGLPEQYRNPENWPEPMRQEWGNDEGLSAARHHRAAIERNLRKAKRILDDFKPDFVLVWGDDQYENFKEDCIPAFCILAYDVHEITPWAHGSMSGRPNAWGEPADKKFVIPGHRVAGKFLASRLLEEGFDVAYAYKPLHYDLGHAFINTVLYLDWDRQGWNHPLLPFQINDYGRRVIANRGFMRPLTEPVTEADLDPPSPPPWRCFDLGAATARILAQSPWRVALIASSSWSHANLTEKTYHLYPDVPADKEMYEALRTGNYEVWRNRPLSVVEESGHHELMNWFALVGAMAELGRKPDETEFIESWIFNSSKCFAYFLP